MDRRFQQLRLGDKIRVQNANELTSRARQTLLEGTGFETNAIHPMNEFDIEALEQECAAAEKKQKAIEANLRAIHSRYVQDYDTIRRRVIPLKAEYNGLPARRQKQIEELHQRLRELQLEQYLDRQFISGAGIPGIGPKRLAALRGFGIETAADVSWRMRAPGFGADLKRKLMAWRQSCELGFRFNPNAQIDPREIQKIDASLHIRRNEVEAELQSINGQLDARTRHLRADLEMAGVELPAAARAEASSPARERTSAVW